MMQIAGKVVRKLNLPIYNIIIIFYVLHYFQDVVNMFASVSDPDYPGHVILEQFQAQVRKIHFCSFLSVVFPLFPFQILTVSIFNRLVQHCDQHLHLICHLMLLPWRVRYAKV